MKLITPAYLKKGDQVALIAPAGFVNDEKPLIIAEQILKSWGLEPIRGEFVMAKDGYFAGSDEERLHDMQNALNNPKIKAVWMVRGGYGIMRIIPKLDFKKFIEKPKWIVGFSDITALHNVLHNKGIKSIHGIMPIQLTEPLLKTEKAVESLKNILFGKNQEYILPASDYNKFGSVKGILVGGNLSLLQSYMGTPCRIRTKDKIVFIEEVGEPLYKIDRLLVSLKSSGFFTKIKGLVVGSFSDIKTDDIPYNKIYQELILETVAEYDIPVLFDAPAGHISDNRALVFGEEVEINVGEFVSCIRNISGNNKPKSCE